MAIGTRTATRNGSSASAPATRAGSKPSPAGKRNAGRIAAGAVVLALSVLAAAAVYSSAADRTAVIGIARDVPPGAELTESDLREVSISAGNGLRTVPADGVSEVLGRTVTAELSAGSLLNPDQLANGPVLRDGTVWVGAVLSSGQFPVGLKIGDTVEIVETTAPDATGDGEPMSRGEGTVTDLADSTDGQGVRTVSIAVPADDAAPISAAGAAGRLSLVVTAP